MTKKGFTLIELIIGLLVIGVGLISIMTLLKYSTRVTNTTKAQIIATNLAREGIEIMFNKRDTNWNIYSSKKDACRLVNATQTGITNCETLARFTPTGLGTGYATYSGLYNNTLLSGAYTLIPQTTGLNIKETNGQSAASMSSYQLCLQNNRWDYCKNFQPVSTNKQTAYGAFRRMIDIKGLYDKSPVTNGGNIIPCTNGNTATSLPVVFAPNTCGSADAKELRFCSRVDYIFDAVRTVELCSVMTNFTE